MFRICTGTNGSQGNAVAVILAAVAGLLTSFNLQCAGLTLQQVESHALRDDPSVQMVQSDSKALQEMAVAAAQLPDPLLKVGMVSVPLDSFDLTQEPMTQLQLGLVQRFPRGQTRSLQSDQISERSRAMDKLMHDRVLRIRLTLRESFTEVVLQKKLAGLTEDARTVFADLAEITQDYYASGRVQQQDVLRAGVELGRIDERSSRFIQAEEKARAALAVYIENAAFQPLSDNWPALQGLQSADDIRNRLSDHPRIQALQQQVLAAETGVELARQKYKPQFAVDMTYGGRGGHNPDGSSRSDFLSLMVVMDLPLFTGNRQDRVTAAKIAESSSALFNRDDVYRRMTNELDLHLANLQRQQERLVLYEEILLPQAGFSAEASFEAYQSSVGDLTALMRARITEYELKIEHARLQAELLKTQARLLYLQGDIS